LEFILFCSHILLSEPEIVNQRRLDYLLILPWDFAVEVVQQNAKYSEKGTRTITVIPNLGFL
tara:strand:+ start:1928 stop:2113 length:186 start_codon:yes stop_codon:yes gene_type:complete